MDLSKDTGYAGNLKRLRGYLTDALARRGDGYSDGRRLLVGTAPHNLMPFMTMK
ncbi:hypothetical protein SDC9_130792 [bioreactor metagenome]|uniref:Uncharacterized protein n=1 Tax=bioreactor metagenome TaxID=1076179 RepID=A0A645D3N6_9ZZZZ